MKTFPARTLVSSFVLSSFPLTLALSLPTTLPGHWSYQGCWTDVPGRTFSGASYADGTNMTIENCISYCTSKGFPYAGAEYSQECWCDSGYASGATKAAESDCSMACTGDDTEPCGGPSRLSVFHTTDVLGPQPSPGVNGYVYMGCYAEGTTGRALTYGAGLSGSDLTVEKCTAACHAANYILAGVEYGGECYCGNTIANGGAPATSGCSMTCNGNSSELCGGPNRLNVYNYQNQYSASSTPTATLPGNTDVAVSTTPAATPTGPSQPATVGNYVWNGCRTEATNIRALSDATFAADTMTLEACQSFCSAYTYFGTEYARECYCGNSFNAGSVPAPDTDCNFPCAGDGSEYCGAGNRLSVYGKNGTAPASSTSSAPATTTSSSPVVTGLPAGWTAQGCWIDGLQGRILPDQLPDSQSNSPAECANACAAAGYIISGTEYGVQCFCGNAIYNGGAKTADSDCNMACPGDATQTCGAGNRLNIVSKGTPQAYAPPAPQTGGLGDWTYQGCVEDNLNQKRTFFWQLYFPGNMTPAMCLDRCAKYGYMAAGLEYGDECYCGDPANMETSGATFRPESECNVVCAGNASAICGGGSRLSTYFWTGTPFYSWDFPTDYRAGKYELLVWGVNTPLITQESITGKVTLLSKGATGPGNETGAYELDLATLTFRTLHIKTDVFCAASVTLPDKVGRQLNVGGWAGDATYGTRLYWPDGSPGVPGTHDWQENVNELKLQAGRWYPSVMVMTNGSILVVGGLIGSNDAATPSLEILPYTGTPPLYMEWLDRTHPNNLYPFLAVLPGGGIFVQYWNEARILDPVTFATTKVLPNPPGAVNDDLGGRTYPLEGTAVLLPQRWPYSDPLGVLICGGSTIGPGNALDNCVSIEPEAENPTWTIERMPSFRVMSCMAPLPDGTYLIANGALHGVAGFGLGVGPNLNALLYDPTKPVGSRITVAANTTIARMYHSEAITLLDGRVLISGSDPQDGVNPEEYRLEVFLPPYLLSGKPRPTFQLANRDWAWGQTGIPFTLGGPAQNGAITVTLLGSVASTHGNSMGARTIMPRVSCAGTACTVDAPPGATIAPPGWYQFFVLDGGVPAVGVYVRIGGDVAKLGNWPQYPDFSTPGV
ncbi:glyoxal oxidase-like protein [Thermothielavioides terrestris NRRL 8126]|uniref:Glyoxal oxidase-like protein n=1 Tax=Thermothielavioides terrestris (strain ATCC 38088 / NRRL 8126) TaxID=578455 RepID=G2RF87_THETT|nr:glyoxal oxidase-like protein [Thermothielavioides terrestris NRRL 8126]AEO70370.1 glyoxal oxidase-like protein [Thermothielavioides terrestris NRRL 8126]